MKKIQLIPIVFDVTQDKIDYFVEPNFEKANAFLKSKGFDYDLNRGSGLTICRKGKSPLVWLKDKRPWVVAHEMIHAVIYIFESLGHDKITKDNEELFAYFVDYAIKKVLK